MQNNLFYLIDLISIFKENIWILSMSLNSGDYRNFPNFEKKLISHRYNLFSFELNLYDLFSSKFRIPLIFQKFNNSTVSGQSYIWDVHHKQRHSSEHLMAANSATI
ncbi:hypothetical protein BpHYR1_023900 [Brachionus plicatilis]|uniref:Uncharacterized protein n=1 Tax=Brachionus plicatilis TaxID=10195 RepID=A0A3M7R5J7_BRAPC|nr:hypothetical protein BpHYR1_023900 [Brachionus plicatilis]